MIAVRHKVANMPELWSLGRLLTATMPDVLFYDIVTHATGIASISFPHKDLGLVNPQKYEFLPMHLNQNAITTKLYINKMHYREHYFSLL